MNNMKQSFDKWRAEKNQKILDDVDKLTNKLIEIYGDTPATRKTALLRVLTEVDDSGWDTWQAAYKSAISDQTK